MKDGPANLSLILSLVITIAFNSFGQRPDSKYYPLQAKITVKVVDEHFDPVAAAEAWLQFHEKETTGVVNVRGQTESKGLFSAQGYLQDSELAANVTKNGYYLSCTSKATFTNYAGGKLQPWNPTAETLLRKTGNAIPMYARVANIKVPTQDTPCGFELKKADWVAPWGKGLVADFVFTAKSAYTNYNHFDSSMKLAFSNPLDGIQPANLPKEFAYSILIWHRLAPEDGYLREYEQEHGMPAPHYEIPSAPDVRRLEDVKKQKFYFRVRTVEKDGKIGSALYGKLSAGFEMRIPN